MAYNPNNPNGQTTSANSAPVVIANDQSAIPVSAGSLPLPSGASTAALQTSGNASLTSIDAKLTSPLSVTGPLTDAQLRATPVPISGTVSTGGLTDAQLRATPVAVDGSSVTQPISAVSLPLPSGAATSALQTTANSSLSSIDSKLTSPLSVTGPLTDVQLRATPIPVSGTVSTDGLTDAELRASPVDVLAAQSGTWNINNISGTVSLPTGAATSALQTTANSSLSSIDSKLTSPLSVTGPLTDAQLRATPVPVSGTVSTNGLTDAELRASPIDVSAAQSGTWNINNVAGTISLPTGAATSALQTTANSSLSSIDSKLTAPLSVTGPLTDTELRASAVVVDGSSVTQPVSAASLPLPTGASTAALQTSGNASLSSIDSKLTAPLAVTGPLTDAQLRATPVPVSGTVSTDGLTDAELRASPVAVSGTVAATQSGTWNINNISGTVSLPTGAATDALQTTGNSSLSSINSKIPSLGQATMSASQPVAIASDQSTLNTASPDLNVTGQSAQTATVNNILTTTSGTAATDLTGYRSASVQVVSTGTAGTFIFEGSNDNTNFQTIPVWNQIILTGTPISAAITATNSQLVYTFPIQTRYVRLRIATTITGGSIQAVSRFSQNTWVPGIVQVAQATTANLQTTATIASGTVTTVSAVTSANLAIPGIIADVASAALTTTTTTATLTPTFGPSYQVSIPVTVVSGTNPTLDITIQESRDTGTNWTNIYDFPRITATGFYVSPLLPLSGNRVRYVQTVSGTTPSFTRAINRLQSSSAALTFTRQLIDRSISLTTLNSTTASVSAEMQTKNVMLTLNIGAATTVPILQIQASDDGSTWYDVGQLLYGVASSSQSITIQNITAQLFRARVATAGTGVTAGYTLLRAF